jgi:hypothetical protein
VLAAAADQARQLGHGWVGAEHYLLALLAEPSVATQALAELGVTYDRFEDYLRTQLQDLESTPPRYEHGKGLSPSTAAYKLEARAEGMAFAVGHRGPAPEHFLLAMVYNDHGMAGSLHHLGATQPAILEALGRRGVRLPEADPPLYRPWRGHHRVHVDEAELKPLIDLLIQQHPPGSQWRWGFNWLPGTPRRARVDAEEGINLDAVLTELRRAARS